MKEYTEADMTGLEVTDVQVFAGASANVAINDSFMIQLGSYGKWSIPSSYEASWDDDSEQDSACETYNADEIAERLDLVADIEWLRENFICSEL
ncbi:TPA: hypothetical protein ACF39K_003949 [Vibrio parahaemolyticus]|uniref:hypothetical protein n=2 Tax=Vibrio parahaemolyticus TaxID=670 RepID=UPI001A8FF20C|nr:hypothetical protein [Vibrio parahaemolyticus]HDY7621953.1 hypothetical protein [Vibrio vulnificus]MBO0159786.1 hypothetical protein [Vibrio parahaemolyticus]MBO0173472.1 hypothetical protein [Vibrio parahaemolyticus]HCE1578020.1 hypothetical protein [Vibrio parahaemolyticus]HCE1578818.1 hypothetical protein [Vibrio parahaemolyticus]